MSIFDPIDIWKRDKAALINAVVAAGATLGRGGKIHCPFTEAHANGDRHPSGAIYANAEGEYRFKCHGCKYCGSVVDFVAMLQSKTPAQVITEHRKANGDTSVAAGKYGGFVRTIKQPRRQELRTPEPPTVDMLTPAKAWCEAADVSPLVSGLGVSMDALQSQRTGRATIAQLADMKTPTVSGNGAWCWPMRCHQGKVIGIRTRFDCGKKRAVTGSRQGLFYDPTLTITGDTLHVVEGVSDVLAMLTLGFSNVVGLPSAGQGAELLTLLIQRLQPPRIRALLIADRDDAGTDGMCRVARVLARHGIPCRVTEPPGTAKDVRGYLNGGGDAAGIEMLAHGEAERTVAA